MNYQDLFQYGQLDLEAAQCMMENDYYSHAALLAQQALEKHVKAYLLKNNIFKNTSGLRHLPISGIIEKMKEYAEGLDDDSGVITSPELISLFQSMETFLSKLETNSELQVITWKQSMSIPLTNHELEIDDGSMNKMRQSSNNFESSLPKFQKQFGEKANISELKKIDIEKLSIKEKALVDFLIGIHDGLDEGERNLETTIELLENLLKHVGYGSGKGSLGKENTKGIQDFLILNKCLNWADTMVQAYTHQIISRYPMEIDEKMGVDLYVEYKNELKEWIQQIMKICTEIRK